MMFTFLAAQGHRSGQACSRKTRSRPFAATWPKPTASGVTIEVPTDVVVASKFGADAEHAVTAPTRSSPHRGASHGIGLDIGPRHRSAVR
jgi:phosphoglycerate kinase